MTDSSITLRPVTVDDAQFLHKLCSTSMVSEALAIGPHGVDYWRLAVQAWDADPDEQAFVIQPRGSDTGVGWIALNGLQSGDRTAWVKMMAISPENWNRGYCKASIAVVKQMLRRRGFLKVSLWTDVSNRGAIRCYEASGFVRVKEASGLVGDPPVERLRAEYECRLDTLDLAGNA